MHLVGMVTDRVRSWRVDYVLTKIDVFSAVRPFDSDIKQITLVFTNKQLHCLTPVSGIISVTR